MIILGSHQQAVQCYAVQVNDDNEGNRKRRIRTKSSTKNDGSNSSFHNSFFTNESFTSYFTKSSKSEKNSQNVKTTSIPIYAFELTTNSNEWWLESKMEKQNNDDTTRITLLILDPQNDFHEGGSLAVPGICIFN